MAEPHTAAVPYTDISQLEFAMIARPINRPRPIPFEAPNIDLGDCGNRTRPISWAGASGPAVQPAVVPIAPVTPIAVMPIRPMISPARSVAMPSSTPLAPMAARLSPVKVASSSAKLQAKDAASRATELLARYVGQGALSVRSSVTGRHYRFQGYGDSQVVDKHDLMLLRRISDLIVA